MLEFRDRGTSATQFAVMSGEVVIASLYKGTLGAPTRKHAVMLGPALVWQWSFKMSAGPPGFQQHGTAPSFEEAKAAIEAQWRLWVAAVGMLQV